MSKKLKMTVKADFKGLEIEVFHNKDLYPNNFDHSTDMSHLYPNNFDRSTDMSLLYPNDFDRSTDMSHLYPNNLDIPTNKSLDETICKSKAE